MPLGAVQGFNQMEAKLGFNRAVHFKYRALEHHIIKGFNHITLEEFTQVATLFFRWAGAVFLGQLAKVFTLI